MMERMGRVLLPEQRVRLSRAVVPRRVPVAWR